MLELYPAARPFKTAPVEDGIPFASFAVEGLAAERNWLDSPGVGLTKPPVGYGSVSAGQTGIEPETPTRRGERSARQAP